MKIKLVSADGLSKYIEVDSEIGRYYFTMLIKGFLNVKNINEEECALNTFYNQRTYKFSHETEQDIRIYREVL